MSLDITGSRVARRDNLVRDAMADWRDAACARLRDRFQQARDEGDLPPDADAELLARYLMTVSNGIAVQAPHNWPPA